ncbi:MAG TPA: VIT domain-containing protein [Planctomycetota bacterium]|jgi:Ca-activated chloride channel family protein
MNTRFLALGFALVMLGLCAGLRAEALFVPIVDQKAVRIAPQPPPIGISPIAPPPDPWRPPMPNALPFRVTSSKVDIRIDDTVATTTLEQSFLNQTGRDLEVRVMIPLPAGAAINNSALSMNDQMVEGTLRNAQEAMNIYQSIVNQRRDPALLRFAGQNLYEARIFPVPPNQERRLKFSYTQMLSPTGGLYDYKHILSGSQLYQNGIEKFDLTCTVRAKNRLGPIYSPSHQVAISRPDEKTATIKLNSANLATDSDFRLFYAPTAEDVSLRVLTHRTGESDEGYFMLLGRVDDQLENAKILPKEIVFAVDTSGSMQGEKMEQTKKALKFCLGSLREGDRFNLITFSTEVQGLSSNKLLDATKANVDKALAAVDQIEATGGTNIDGAMRAALGSDFTPGSAKAKMVVFMTDGLPTVGVTDPQSILKQVTEDNQKNKVRIFNFGVGNDVNTHLLDRLSVDHDGVSTYVSPREDIEIKVSDFYSKIRHPVMTDVAFDFGPDSKANSIYPKRIPALFRGGEISILGRYKGTAPGEITLTGSVAGEPRKITVKTTWPGRDLDNSYMPRLWAMRKVGHLLEDVRLRGENQEIIHEIVELSQRHGIVTPYTSQLVLEPGMENNWRQPRPVVRDGRQMPPAASMPAEEALRMDFGARDRAESAAKGVGGAARAATSGEMANALARVEKELKDTKVAVTEADRPASAPAKPGDLEGQKKEREKFESRRQLGAAMRADAKMDKSKASDDETGYALERAQTEGMKQIGSRTFYNRGGVWVDSLAKKDAKPVTVKAFTPEYFELIKADETLGPVLALGGKILVVVGEKLYQVEE